MPSYDKSQTDVELNQASDEVLSVDSQSPVSDTAEAPCELASEPAAVEAQPTRAEQGAVFMEAFGEERGSLYFARGLDLADAMKAHMEFQSSVIDDLKSRLEAKPTGEESPLSFSASDAIKKKEPLTRPAEKSNG